MSAILFIKKFDVVARKLGMKQFALEHEEEKKAPVASPELAADEVAPTPATQHTGPLSKCIKQYIARRGKAVAYPVVECVTDSSKGKPPTNLSVYSSFDSYVVK